MPNSKSLRISFLSLIAMLLITSCYHKHERTTPDAITYTEEQLDSISFSSTHHYTNNYNFVVKADSLVLLKQQPEEKLNSLMTDSFVVKKHDALVVADIRILPTDSIDSVWVQVARDQSTFGWIHESTLLKKVVPDAPHEVLLVIDGSTGQNGFLQAKEFTRATDVTALAVTKLDGSAKGGVVIGISDQFKIPIKFIGVGEKIDDLKLFDKKEFVESLFD